MLEIDGVEVRYGQVAALKGASLRVGKGQLVALIGANGAGKSTMLRTISGLLTPAAGTIRFENEIISGANARVILARGIAHCPEGRRIFSQLSVQENLEMGAYLRRDGDGVERDMARIFEQFPRLAERRRQVAGTLSGGEQQMLAIGRALMSQPKLVLFDEPSLGLAPNIVEQVFEIISAIVREGLTVLMVEQNAYAALDMCDHAYLLESGVIIRDGDGKALASDEHVRQAYLGG
jgi:branched-chain amino acid transport system ATP-binding protein